MFSPLDFISKLAALIPAPRIHLSRYHGIFASHAKNRDQFINQQNKTELTDNRTEKEKVACMRWAMRLKRAFNIDVTLCEACGGQAKVIASIEDPAVIEKILKSIKHTSYNQILLPICRAPPA